MSITLPLSPLVTLFAEHPWPVITLVFLLGVVLPIVWVPFCRVAGLDVLRLILNTAASITIAVCGAPVPRKRR